MAGNGWMSDEDWLAARRRVLTATDAAAILGVHPWKSALQVYAEKVQGVELTQATRRMRWGQRLEDDVADAYSEESGRRVALPETRLSIHPAIPWMGASLDRLVEDDVRGRGVLEIKAIWRSGDDEVPAHWLVQVAHQMEVAQLPWASIASLSYGERLEWTDVEADGDFRRLLLARLEEFWERVQRRRPPAPDASDSAARAVRALYHGDDGTTATLPPESATWARSYVEASQEITRLGRVKQEAQNRLMAAMGEASLAVAADGTRFTFKTEHRKGSNTPAQDVRVFRRVRG
ncbi:MAG: YqaJ viral recombinase family protein [Acidobacteriota bacterium]